MGDFSTRLTTGTYQYFDGSNTTFAGSEVRYGGKRGYIGIAGSVATDDFKKYYGLIDVKGKINYDKDGIFEANARIRNNVQKDIQSTQIRISPFTVNIPLTKGLSIYSNTHYSGKYNYKDKTWKHSAGNFTGVSYDINKKLNISIEEARYNLQNIRNNSPENWGINCMLVYKF